MISLRCKTCVGGRPGGTLASPGNNIIVIIITIIITIIIIIIIIVITIVITDKQYHMLTCSSLRKDPPAP